MTDHILFGTPGTVQDWILRRHVVDPKKIKMFVLDEADVMITLQGHHDQAIRIRKSVNYCFTAKSMYSTISHQVFLELYYFRDFHLCTSPKYCLQNLEFRLDIWKQIFLPG